MCSARSLEGSDRRERQWPLAMACCTASPPTGVASPPPPSLPLPEVPPEQSTCTQALASRVALGVNTNSDGPSCPHPTLSAHR